MGALPALRIVHRELLARVLECRDLAGARIDPEAVHDLRVAIRRTRAALGQIRDVYVPEARTEHRAELGWLGRNTGEARDLDVFIEWLRGFEQGSSPRMAEALQPLLRHLVETRDAEQTRLTDLLSSDRCKRALERWSRFLAAPEGDVGGPAADRPIEELVLPRFDLALEKTRRRAAELGVLPDNAAIHRLRLAAKKARYLIDLFPALHTPDTLERLSPAFRAIQDALGDHHDAALQEQRVLRFAESLASERGNAPAVLALGRLVGELGRRQSAVRRRLPGLLEPFEVVDRKPKAT
jgi:CHAD domain-containing protein